MKKSLSVTKNMSLQEQKRRNSFNLVFEEMRMRAVFTENEVKNYLIRQTSFETSGGYVLSYDEALAYFNEVTEVM